MTRFVKLEDGSYVNVAAIQRIHLEKHTDPKFWKLNAQLSRLEGGGEWAYLAGEHDSQKDAEDHIKKLGK